MGLRKNGSTVSVDRNVWGDYTLWESYLRIPGDLILYGQRKPTWDMEIVVLTLQILVVIICAMS
jgi:hypothetical protein